MLISLLCLNKCDKRLSAEEKAKYSLCRLTGSSHIKALFKADCSLCVGCLLVATVSCVFFVLLLVVFRKDSETLSLHVVVVLGRLVDDLEREAEVRETVRGQSCQESASVIGNQFKWIPPDHPWSQWS